MRIVCESCGTKYSISDEKVRGKLFKIRCKKCSHVIVVRGAQGDGAAGYVEDQELDADGGSQEWFYVLDGQQAGPVSIDELRDLLAAGEIQPETYMWRDGMDDWLHLAEVPDLASLVSESTEAPPMDLHTAEPASVGNGADADAANIYAGSGDEADYSDDDEATRVMAQPSEPDEPAPSSLFGPDEATSPRQSPADEGGGLGSVRSSGFGAFASGGGSDFFSERSSSSALDSGAGLFAGGGEGFGVAPTSSDDSSLVGARSENSVLFSLDTLSGVESTGEGNGSSLPTTEGSGLIDIKALAASQASTTGTLEGEATSADHPVITPAVMPMGQRQSHKMLYALIGAGALVIIGLIVAIVVVLSSRQPSEVSSGVATGPEVEQLATSQGEQPAQTPEQPPETTTTSAVAQPDQAAGGPSQESVLQATQNGALRGAYVSNAAQAAAQAVSTRPSQTASRERDRDRDRERERASDTPTASRETSSPEQTEEREERRDRDRERERERASSNDPVEAALSRIRGGGEDEQEEQRDDRTAARDPHEDEDEDSASDSDLPESLTTSQVSRTIRRYQRRLTDCRRQSGLPAGEVLRVDVDMTVQGNGRVASARTSSSDAAADCIVDVARDMRFDRFSGEAMSFTYPFRVR